MRTTTRILFGVGVGLLILAVLAPGADEPASTPIPQGTVSAAPARTKVEQPPVKVDSCDAAREAILTGTPAQIEAAFKVLIADTTADGTAREYARYYLVRDKNDKRMREMDIGLIQMGCA